jgi:hypothetical protein
MCNSPLNLLENLMACIVVTSLTCPIALFGLQPTTPGFAFPA